MTKTRSYYYEKKQELRKDSKKVTKIEEWQHEEFMNNIIFFLSGWQL